jgi:hypothetical protein
MSLYTGVQEKRLATVILQHNSRNAGSGSYLAGEAEVDPSRQVLFCEPSPRLSHWYPTHGVVDDNLKLRSYPRFVGLFLCA